MARANSGEVEDSPSLSIPSNPIPGPVEARSLSSITTIASNPPAYPRNPTQKTHDPLELYIVRVPGSRGTLSSHTHPSFLCLTE